MVEVLTVSLHLANYAVVLLADMDRRNKVDF